MSEENKNITEEVEATLRTLDTVRDALCVGLEDSEWGQLVAAVIETDSQLTLDDLRESLRNKIASHKLPKRITTVAKLPTLANGKPDYQSKCRHHAHRCCGCRSGAARQSHRQQPGHNLHQRHRDVQRR